MNRYYIIFKLRNFLSQQVILPGLLLLLLAPLLFPLITAWNYQAEAFTPVGQPSEQISFVNNSLPQIQGVTSKNTASIKLINYDYRGFVLDKYFAKYHSPLTGYGNEFVNACDRYAAPKDCTTVAAIAYIETHLCTTPSSVAQRNCWGFGGSNENRIRFNSFEEAIDLVTKRLSQDYGSYYMLNPQKMQAVYCGSGCITWGQGVQQARYEINAIAVQYGFLPMIR